VKLVVTSFATLDGIVEAPEFDEHRTGRNAWALRVHGEEDQVFNKEDVLSADALSRRGCPSPELLANANSRRG
jgi:hypothetical protein